MTSTPNVLDRIAESGLVTVIRAGTPVDAVRIAEASFEGGAIAVEITFTVPDAAQVIEELSNRSAFQGYLIGAGTVLDRETANAAIQSGAQFIVSPALNEATAELCGQKSVPYLPGAATVREIIDAMNAGAGIVKVFPGEVLGPAFVRAVKTVLPHAKLMPTGGVSLDNVRAWINAGSVAVGVGGSLTSPAARGDFRAIAELTKQFINEIQQARS